MIRALHGKESYKMKKRVSFIRPIILFFSITNLTLTFPFLLYIIYPALGMSFQRALINSISTFGLAIITLAGVSVYIFKKLKLVDNLVNKQEDSCSLSPEQKDAIITKERQVGKTLIVISIIVYIVVGVASVISNTLRDGLLRWATIRFLFVVMSLGPVVAFLSTSFISYIMQRVKYVAGIYEFDLKKARYSFKKQFLSSMFAFFFISSLILAFLAIAREEKVAGISNVARVFKVDAKLEQAQGHFTELLQLARQSTDLEVKAEAERVFANWEQETAFKNAGYIFFIWFIILLFFMFGCFIIAANVSAQLKGIISSLQKIVGLEGDLRNFLVKSSSTEIGEIQTLFNKLILNVNHLFKNIFNTATKIIGEIKNEKSSLEYLIKFNKEVTTTSREVSKEVVNQSQISTKTADGVKSVVELIQQNMEKITEQSTSIEETSASIIEMNSSINSVTNIARKAAELGGKLTLTSENGLKVTNAMQESINRVTQSGEGINQIVKTLSKITSQTNMLAMNAAIEAAHAGEYGRGFAVVAEEIRRLSDGAGQQTKQIINILKEMQNNITDSVSNSRNLNDGMQAILTDISQTIQLIKEIGSATEEQLDNTMENMNVIRNLVENSSQLMDSMENQKVKNKDLLDATKEMEISTVKIESVGKMQEEYFLNLQEHYQRFFQFFVTTEDQLLILEEQLKKIKLVDI
jgi:methyl-accepting chemotaxis protein